MWALTGKKSRNLFLPSLYDKNLPSALLVIVSQKISWEESHYSLLKIYPLEEVLNLQHNLIDFKSQIKVCRLTNDASRFVLFVGIPNVPQ